MRNAFVEIDDVSRQCFRFRVWELKSIFLLEEIELESAGEYVFIFRNLLLHEFLCVIFILDLSKEFFQHILHGDDARSPSKLIHHPRNALTLSAELANQVCCTHALWHGRNGKKY